MSTVTATPRASYAFMVWRKSKGRPPRFRHETQAAAETEATRLAASNPGVTFVVLQELKRFVSNPVSNPSAHQAEPGGGSHTSPGSNAGATAQ